MFDHRTADQVLEARAICVATMDAPVEIVEAYAVAAARSIQRPVQTVDWYAHDIVERAMHVAGRSA